jgi:ATP synthase protein I
MSKPGPLGRSLGSGGVGATGIGLAGVLLSGLLAGVHGAVSAACGLAVVVLFFVVSLYLVEVANRVSPSLTLPVGMTVFSTLLLWLAVLAFSTSLPDHLHKAAFSWTVIGSALGWVLAQAVAVWRWQMPYVDVDLPTSAGRSYAGES